MTSQSRRAERSTGARTISLRAPAKVNLHLEVLRRLPDGYHEIETVLQAVQLAIDEGLARPILVGRPEVLKLRVQQIGLRIQIERDVEIVDPEFDPCDTAGLVPNRQPAVQSPCR